MSERHHRRSPERRRVHETFDKTLYRLPAPFYRLPDRTIKAGPAAAEVMIVVPQWAMRVRDGDLSIGMRLVRGWRVVRANDLAIGYYMKDEQGFMTLERHGALLDEDESITWCRTWSNDEAIRALIAAAALR